MKIEHLADLARIDLTQKEKTKFKKELLSILKFVEKLNEVDTSNVQPLSGGTLLENKMRPDVQISKDLEGESLELLTQTSEKKDGWVRVKAVFE